MRIKSNNNTKTHLCLLGTVSSGLPLLSRASEWIISPHTWFHSGGVIAGFDIYTLIDWEYDK